MQSRIYRFEIVRAIANAVFEARDPASSAPVVLYEWTPAPADREAAKRRLEELADTLKAEVFTADASLYLAAPSQALAREPLQMLRANGLFTGTWLNDPQPAPTPPVSPPVRTPAIPPAQPVQPPPPTPVREPPRAAPPVAPKRSIFPFFLVAAISLAGGALLDNSLWPAPRPNCPVSIIDNSPSTSLQFENHRLQDQLRDQAAAQQGVLEQYAGVHLLRVRNACSVSLRTAAEYTGFNGEKAVQGWTSIAPGSTGIVAASPSPDFLLYAVSSTGQTWSDSSRTLDIVSGNFLYPVTAGLSDESKTNVAGRVVRATSPSDVLSLSCAESLGAPTE